MRRQRSLGPTSDDVSEESTPSYLKGERKRAAFFGSTSEQALYKGTTVVLTKRKQRRGRTPGEKVEIRRVYLQKSSEKNPDL